MRKYKLDKPLIESSTPPKDKNVYWVDVNEKTGKLASIKEYKNGEWASELGGSGNVNIAGVYTVEPYEVWPISFNVPQMGEMKSVVVTAKIKDLVINQESEIIGSYNSENDTYDFTRSKFYEKPLVIPLSALGAGLKGMIDSLIKQIMSRIPSDASPEEIESTKKSINALKEFCELLYNSSDLICYTLTGRRSSGGFRPTDDYSGPTFLGTYMLSFSDAANLATLPDVQNWMTSKTNEELMLVDSMMDNVMNEVLLGVTENKECYYITGGG